MIILGSDHAGYEMKETILQHLLGLGFEVKDCGAFSSASIDYAPIALDVSRNVMKGKNDFGILCCGTGIGVSLAANKVKGIRAALCYSVEVAGLARQHNNANIICIGARFTELETALNMVDTFLSTPFEGDRHARRVDQITSIENDLL